VAIAAVIATVVVVTVGAVVLLHGRRAPIHAAVSSQPAPAADAAAWARIVSCSQQRGSTIDTTDASPDPRLLAALGVLRGPWSPADAAPARACKAGTQLFPDSRIDVRYVRYVGPGVRGGSVFLVPGTWTLPRLPKGAPVSVLARLNHEPLACLITIGAKSAGGSEPPTACSMLPQIERPAGATYALSASASTPRAITTTVARRLCGQLTKHAPVKLTQREFAACVHEMVHPHVFPVPPQVISGVVRDGIATVDVYARGGRRLLTAVRVQDNVFSFLSGGAIAGDLTLVFKESDGHAVRTTPVHFGIVNTSSSVVTSKQPSVAGTSSPSPALSGTGIPSGSNRHP